MHVEISIVIPCHNATATLTACLDAVFGSSFRNFEVITVDDASTDGTVSVFEKYPCRVFHNTENRGPSYCRNFGVGQAQGEIILLLDSDVLIEPDTLERIHRFFKENPAIDVYQGRYSDRCYFDNLFSRYKNYKLAFRELSRPNREVAFINTSLVALRKSVFEKYRFDESVRRAEDSLFGWRYYSDGNKIILDNTLQAVHMKQYSIGSFVRYQFRSGENLMLAWLHKSLGSAILSESNSLSNRLQLLRAPLSLLVAATLVSIAFVSWTWWAPLLSVLLIIAVLLQADYLKYVLRVGGAGMALASIFIYLLDGFVSALGVGWGLLQGLLKRPHPTAISPQP